ncbi:unnamed protein product [Merluccius merluccius]
MDRRTRFQTATTPAEATRPTRLARLRSSGGPLLPSRDVGRGRRQRERRSHPTRHPSPPNRWGSLSGPIRNPRHHDGVREVRRSRGDGEFPPYGAL